MDYKPPNGETWPLARERAIDYFRTLGDGHHLISTHGGLMCALMYHLGVQKVVPNCSIISGEFCHNKKDVLKLNFVW